VSQRIRPKKPVRSWRVIIMRSKSKYLGSVDAPDRESAEGVAIKQFALDNDQRRRLLIREGQSLRLQCDKTVASCPTGNLDQCSPLRGLRKLRRDQSARAA
jgi:hypothetical protein